MSEDRKYVRVYYNDLIRDYPEVWADDAALATWLRMLATADPMWPTPPELPRSVKPRSLVKLTDSTLVETMPQHRFRMKGLDMERSKRQDSARNAAAVRWQSEGNATAMPNTSTSKDEQSNNDGREDLEAFLLIHRRAPSVRQRALLDGVLQRHDLTGPKWAADIMLRHPDDAIGAVIKADKEWRDEQIAAAQQSEKPKAIARRPRGLPQTTREILAEMKLLDAEKAKAAS